MKKLLLVLITLVLFTSMAYSQELPAPAAGNAKVYVFNFMGSIIRTPVMLFLDQEFIGKINGSNAYGIDLAPGEYVLWAKNTNKKWFIKLNVAADKTYYVHLQPTPPKFGMGTDAPVLYNACPNSKKGKKRFREIKKRLDKDKFVMESSNTPDYLAQARLEQAATIVEVWDLWINEWAANKKWEQINPEDGE